MPAHLSAERSLAGDLVTFLLAEEEGSYADPLFSERTEYRETEEIAFNQRGGI